jgi:hypothetical protein
MLLTTISSTYATMFLRRWGWRAIAIILENVHPAFFSPSGMLTKQKVPKGVMKPVLSLSEDHVWFEDRWMVASLCDEWLTTLCGLILG